MRFIVKLVLFCGVICSISLGGPTLSFAEASKDAPVDLKMTIVCTGEARCGRGIRAFKDAAKYYKKRLNINLTINKVIVQSKGVDGTFLQRVVKWLDAVPTLGVPDDTDGVLFFVDPFPVENDVFDFDEESIIGLATNLGVLGIQPCAAFVKNMGSEQFVSRVTIHEIGHLLGAQHVGEGLMHPNASVNQYSDELAIVSLDQIRQHLANLNLFRNILKLTKPSANTRIQPDPDDLVCH